MLWSEIFRNGYLYQNKGLNSQCNYCFLDTHIIGNYSHTFSVLVFGSVCRTSALGQELNSIKTGANSATLYVPENYGSCVIGDILMFPAKFSANCLHQTWSSSPGKRHRQGLDPHIDSGCRLDVTQLPARGPGPVSCQWTCMKWKTSYKAVQSLMPWSEEMIKSALSQLGPNKKGCSLMTRVSVVLPGANSDPAVLVFLSSRSDNRYSNTWPKGLSASYFLHAFYSAHSQSPVPALLGSWAETSDLLFS